MVELRLLLFHATISHQTLMSIKELYKQGDKFTKQQQLNKVQTNKNKMQQTSLSMLLDQLEYYQVDCQFVEHLVILKLNLNLGEGIQMLLKLNQTLLSFKYRRIMIL